MSTASRHVARLFVRGAAFISAAFLVTAVLVTALFSTAVFSTACLGRAAVGTTPADVASALLGSASAHAQRFDALPRFGSHALRATPAGRELDLPVEAGGDTSTSDLRLAAACRGYIDAAAPTLRIDYLQHGAGDVVFEVQSDARTALIINGSDGVWYCAQPDPEGRTALRLADPNSGQIDVWLAASTVKKQAARLRIFATD